MDLYEIGFFKSGLDHFMNNIFLVASCGPAFMRMIYKPDGMDWPESSDPGHINSYLPD